MPIDEKMNELVDLQHDLLCAMRNAESEIERIELREKLEAVEGEIADLCDVSIEIDE